MIITNEHHAGLKALITQYARRMTIEQRLAEIIRSFCADALSSTVNLNADLDIMLAVLAQALLAAFRTRLGARPASRPTPPSPGGTGGACTSSSANPGKLHGNRR